MEQRFSDMTFPEFEDYASQIIAKLVSYRSTLGRQPVSPNGSFGDLLERLPASIPADGRPMAEIIDEFFSEVLPRTVHWNHPGFLGWFNSSSSFPAVLAELCVSATNSNGMTWASSPALTELEMRTCESLATLLGLPQSFWGISYDCGSTSTLHALATARHRACSTARESGIVGQATRAMRVYVTRLTHSSVAKASILLGIGCENVVEVAHDETGSMLPDALRTQIESDLRQNNLPMCVVATLGTTACTSFDPVGELAQICDRLGVWLHVDAAHGAAAALLSEKAHLFSGWEHADSIVVNPHKWFFTPIGLSILLTRHREEMRSTFSLVPDYLANFSTDGLDLMDYGIPLARRFRALSLWFVLNYFGQHGLQSLIRQHIDLAQEFAQRITRTGRFAISNQVLLSTVAFRAVSSTPLTPHEEKTRHRAILHAVNHRGEIFLTDTLLGNRPALRVVFSGLHVDRASMLSAVRNLVRAADEAERGQGNSKSSTLTTS